MGKRSQRRQKAILPIKLHLSADGKNHLAHTLDISASGARLVLAHELDANTPISLEFKRRKANGVVAWCRPVKGSKFDYEIGVHLLDSGQAFWGVQLPINEFDPELETQEPIAFDKVMSLLSQKHA